MQAPMAQRGLVGNRLCMYRSYLCDSTDHRVGPSKSKAYDGTEWETSAEWHPAALPRTRNLISRPYGRGSDMLELCRGLVEAAQQPKLTSVLPVIDHTSQALQGVSLILSCRCEYLGRPRPGVIFTQSSR